MAVNTKLIDDIKRKVLVKYPRFGSEIATSSIEFKDDLPYHTAATDGKKIYVDPNYFASLSEDDRLFIIAHEIMHIKFMRMLRLKDKSGNMRDLKVWNIATDAIINANLERDGFTIKEGYVNMPEALNYSAEEFYQILLEENQKQQSDNGQNQEQEQQNGNGQNQEQQQNGEGNNQEQQQNPDQEQQNGNGQGNGQENEQDKNSQNSDGGQQQGDDHSLWEEAFKEQQESQGKQKGKNSKKQQSQEQSQEHSDKEQATAVFDERGDFEDNRKEKREKFKFRREKIESSIRSTQTQDGTIKLGNIGEGNEAIDWKALIRIEIGKSETIWSQRRSIAENNYAYRLEENDIKGDAETEIMIDVSGSVKLDLVKAFLRQIKPLLKQSKLRVGCFNEKFWGMVDIKGISDIDNFTIPEAARGYPAAKTEDWDLAVRSFTKKREINKIVFTDGYPCPGTMPKEDLKGENIIWLVYGNKEFKPCCGKVINITEKQLEKLHQVDTRTSFDDISR